MQNYKSCGEANGFEGPLRPSLFDGVPPFINFVPGENLDYEIEKSPQYWDVNEVGKQVVNI